MAKLTLTDITDFKNQTATANTINSNSSAIEAALEKTLSRDGTTPNTMSADLDLNGNDLLNVDSITATTANIITSTVNDIYVNGQIHYGPGAPQAVAGPGVPTGGTTGQILIKNSNSNYDTTWSNGLVVGSDVQAYSSDLSDWVTAYTTSVRGGSSRGMDNAGGFFVYNDVTLPNTGYGASLRAQAYYNYTGGTAGSVNSAMTTLVDVAAGVTNHIWADLVILSNLATAGENVASYIAAQKKSTGGTWAAVLDVSDQTGTANPTAGLYAAEVDVNVNGTDNNNTRRGIDIIGGRYDDLGSDAEIAYGLIIETAIADYGHVKFKNGIVLKGSASGGLDPFGIGIDFSQASYATAAIKMADGQRQYFNSNISARVETGLYLLRHDSLGINFLASDPTNGTLDVVTNYKINGTAVVGARNTGWGAMTGSSNKATVYDTSTVTLAQLAGRVMALQAALTTHGLIGV